MTSAPSPRAGGNASGPAAGNPAPQEPVRESPAADCSPVGSPGRSRTGRPSWVSEPVPDDAGQPLSAPRATRKNPDSGEEAAGDEKAAGVEEEDLDAPLVPEEVERLLEAYADIVALFDQHREGLLHADLLHSTRIAGLKRDGDGGEIEIVIDDAMNRDLAANVRRKLEEWTGGSWQVRKARNAEAPTLQQYADMKRARRIARARRHPLVSELLKVFDDATVRDVRSIPAGDASTGDGEAQEAGGAQKGEPAAH